MTPQNPSAPKAGWLTSGLIVIGLIPFAQLLIGALNHRLGANPVETLSHTTGLWALRLLLASLALTPLGKLTGWRGLMPLRRPLALLAFFYACVHAMTYFVFDHLFDGAEIWRDIVQRPYITAGLTSFLILIPLAATSSKALAQRLGRRNWRRLHRWAYVAATAAVFHYFWLVKRDTSGPAVYIAFLAVLLSLRLNDAAQHRSTGPDTTDHTPSPKPS